jgi:aminoglycoside phosphotransferase family enzyme/predicted kinase
MDFPALMQALQDPRAYPGQADSVEMRQTHISAVFLVDGWAFKVKKPVSLGFLDFSTLQKRKHYCEEEVRLNRRLAPGVYLGVVPITRAEAGLSVGGEGEPVEWAVQMARLPDEATLEHQVRQGGGVGPQVSALARRIAEFHAAAAGGEEVWKFGAYEVVAGNARENFEQSAGHVGMTVEREVFERARGLNESWLARLRPLIESRARRGVPRDTHGDLRLGHVYLFPDKPPPDDLVLIDCIEFSERLRFADPVADMAFLAMELIALGRRDLAALFCREYFAASGDGEGESLLSFYVAYRAAVRAKVEGIKATEAEVPASGRERAVARARRLWLVALGELEAPSQRPCLVLACGLPGTGKSTLARGLAGRAGLSVIRSDAVRKELAGIAEGKAASAGFGEGIYTKEWTERTYEECLRRAEGALRAGGRVIVDATFGEESRRLSFLDLAERLGVPVAILCCEASPEEARRRLEGRVGDLSDAGWEVHQQAAARWEPFGARARRALIRIPQGAPDESLERALAGLRSIGLFDG